MQQYFLLFRPKSCQTENLTIIEINNIQYNLNIIWTYIYFYIVINIL